MLTFHQLQHFQYLRKTFHSNFKEHFNLFHFHLKGWNVSIYQQHKYTNKGLSMRSFLRASACCTSVWFYCRPIVCRTALFLVRVRLERKLYVVDSHSELESWMNGNDSSCQVKILDTQEASILNHFLECFLWKAYSMIKVSRNVFYNSFSHKY